MICSRVVLPAPLGPIKHIASPLATLIVTPRNTSVAPNDVVTREICRADCPCLVAVADWLFWLGLQRLISVGFINAPCAADSARGRRSSDRAVPNRPAGANRTTR